jgi:hypothetical protein
MDLHGDTSSEIEKEGLSHWELITRNADIPLVCIIPRSMENDEAVEKCEWQQLNKS